MRNSGILRGLFALLFFVALFASAGLAVMYLWNLLIPSIIGWTAINYWQALGLMVLTRLLFGGFGKFGGFRHFKMRNMSWEERREHIRQQMADFRNGRDSMHEPASDNKEQ